jgi:predicted ester cyclase
MTAIDPLLDRSQNSAGARLEGRRMDVEDVIASGDKAVARVRVTGTNKGEFMGIPATDKSTAVNLIDITRFGDDGLAHEHWGVVDQLALMQQLGVILARSPA